MNAAMSQRAAGEILKPYSVGGSSRLGRWERGGLEGHCGLIQPASSAKQTAQQGHEGGADQRHTAAGHELLHALRLRAGIVGPIPFQQVDAAPHAEAGAQGNHEGLQDFDCAIEKFHGDLLLTIKSLRPVGYTPEIVDFDKLPTAARADLPVYPGAWGK